jgi:hypothetical protein
MVVCRERHNDAPQACSNASFMAPPNAGNLTNDGTAADTYDALNRTTVPGATYAYNGDGTLVSQLTGGVTTRYSQDLAAPLSQVLQTKVGSAAIISFAGRFAPAPPIEGTEAGSPKPPPANKPVPRRM